MSATRPSTLHLAPVTDGSMAKRRQRSLSRKLTYLHTRDSRNASSEKDCRLFKKCAGFSNQLRHHRRLFVALALTTKKRPSLYCSFCGKRDSEVGYLVAGPTVFICNECVELCREIGQQELVSNAVTEQEGRARPSPFDLQQAITLPAARIAEDAISKAFASASRKH